jgi:hypothetical protein
LLKSIIIVLWFNKLTLKLVFLVFSSYICLYLRFIRFWEIFELIFERSKLKQLALLVKLFTFNLLHFSLFVSKLIRK